MYGKQEISNKIKQLQKEGKSVSEISKELGIPRSTLYKMFIDLDEKLEDITFKFFSKKVFEKYYEISSQDGVATVNSKLCDSIIKAGLEFFGSTFESHLRDHTQTHTRDE